jgi:hypothetical protein
VTVRAGHFFLNDSFIKPRDVGMSDSKSGGTH